MQNKCIRCEAMERPQASREVYGIKNSVGETIYLCARCVIEVQEEEEFFSREDFDEEDES